jgi:hypothetical protein
MGSKCFKIGPNVKCSYICDCLYALIYIKCLIAAFPFMVHKQTPSPLVRERTRYTDKEIL